MNDEAPKIDTRAGFAAAVRWGFESAIEGGARFITCVDPHFADWPLDDPDLQSRLAAWLRAPKRRLVLLCADFEALARRHARFDLWRVDWMHAIEASTPPEEDRTELPTVLVDDRVHLVELIDPVHWRGRASVDAQEARLWRDRVDVLLQRSEPAYPAKRLGL